MNTSTKTALSEETLTQTFDHTTNFKKVAQDVVASILDWETARKFDGNNISPMDWANLPTKLDDALKTLVPGIAIDSSLSTDLQLLVQGNTNLNTAERLFKAYAKGHLTAHFLKDNGALEKAASDISRMLEFQERHFVGAGIKPPITHFLAQIVSGSDPELENRRARVDLVRAQEAGLKLV